jgi:hypothetical protein
MFAAIAPLRKLILGPFLVLALMALAACQGVSLGGNSPSLNTSQPVPVALLVPLGSADANEEKLARDLENAARMASSDLAGVQIDLRVYGTAGNADRAREVAGQAVNEGAKIIVGPLHAESANAAAVAVAPKGVNVMTFSNNRTIAGGNLFLLGQTFDSTANRLVSFAVSQGRSRIMTVYADTLAGRLGRQAITEAITRNAATPAGSVSYQFSQQGVVQSVSEIRKIADETQADTIFLTANTAGALPLFTQMLPEAGLGKDKVQYMGLARWDTPAQTLELPGVQGGWFALPDPARSAQFNARFEEAFGAAPHPLAGLAYDGIATVGALARSGKSDALSRASLTQPAGFQGVNGVFRFLQDGTNERGLAVATVQARQVQVISPAPQSFQGAGL